MYEIGIEKNGPGMASEGSVTLRQGLGSPSLVADVVAGDDGEALARLVQLANIGLVVEGNLGLIRGALDSHAYWELSEPEHRSSGYVEEEGQTDEIKEVYALETALAAFDSVNEEAV